eukprot:103375_1
METHGSALEIIIILINTLTRRLCYDLHWKSLLCDVLLHVCTCRIDTQAIQNQILFLDSKIMKHLMHAPCRGNQSYKTTMSQQHFTHWKRESFPIKALQLASIHVLHSICFKYIYSNVWKAIYVFSYNFAQQRNPLLPRFTELFHLSQNKDIAIRQKQLDYVQYLQDKVGIIFWHPAIMRPEWQCDHSLQKYMAQLDKVHTYLLKSISDDDPLLGRYSHGWMCVCVVKLLTSCRYDLDYLVKYTDENAILNYIDRAIKQLAKDGSFDMLKALLVVLKKNNGLGLLKHVIVSLVEELDEPMQIKLFEALIRVGMNVTLNKYVIHTISVSLCWWLQGQRQSSMVILDELASDLYFDKALLLEIKNVNVVYTFSLHQEMYFDNALQRLYSLRKDWPLFKRIDYITHFNEK